MATSMLVSLASGHMAVPVEEEEMSRILKDFPTYTNGAVRLYPGGWFLLKDYLSIADTLYNFKFRETDVVVMTFPKSGTTWAQEIVWTMTNNPDLTLSTASNPLMRHAPYLEMELDQWPHHLIEFLMPVFHEICPGKNPDDGIVLQMLDEAPDPRVIKTHLPLSLLPSTTLDKAKVVYVARNPKDQMVSFYNYSKIQKKLRYSGTLTQSVKYLLQDKMRWSPYWLHVKEAWQQRHHPNLHFVYYEDLLANTEEYRKLNKFLGSNLSDEKLKNVIHHTSFNQMKARDAQQGPNDQLMRAGSFFSAGKTGNWKENLTPELEEEINTWTIKNTADFGKDFKYCL